MDCGHNFLTEVTTSFSPEDDTPPHLDLVNCSQIHAVVTLRLDFYKCSLLEVWPLRQLKFHLVQNAAAQ